MIHRKESSEKKKYSSTPEDLNNLIKETLVESSDAALETETQKVNVRGRIYPEEIILKVSINEGGALRCHNFSGSMDHDVDAGDIIDRMQNLMEALSSMISEYFDAEGDIDMPLDWHEYDFENRKLHLMYSTENDEIERQAEALLGDEFKEQAEEDNDYIGVDFFKEAEEKFKSNLH